MSPAFRFVLILCLGSVLRDVVAKTHFTNLGHGIRVYKTRAIPTTAVLYLPEGRVKREQPGVTGWKYDGGDLQELDQGQPLHTPDKFHVVSSSLRILPRRTEMRRTRSKRSEEMTPEWKKPRKHQFVTTSRMAKYLEPNTLRYYPGDRQPYPYHQDYRRRTPPHRRIIYYAHLPEIVRRPPDWDTRSAAPLSPGYPPLQENEVVTRVQSPVIDVSMRDKFKMQHGAYSSPKITIIDVDPPHHYRYHRQPQYPPPQQDPFTSAFNRYEPPPHPPPHPYHGHQYYSRIPTYNNDVRHHLPPRHIIIPPLPNGVTVVRKPPHDSLRDPTTLSPSQQDYTTTTPSPTTITTSPSYDHSYNY